MNNKEGVWQVAGTLFYGYAYFHGEIAVSACFIRNTTSLFGYIKKK